MYQKLKTYIGNFSLTQHLLIAFGLGTLFHVMAVIFSEGYHRPDEHLGIFRLMSYKLGEYPANELSWEFEAMIRPWLHPWAFVGIAKFTRAIFGDNPFFLAFILRLVSSTIGLYALWLISKFICAVNGSTFHKKVALYLLNLTWFVPFFHARTTAENLGMSLFIFGLYPLIKNTKSVSLESIKTDHLNSWHYVLLGILFGVSFILRFQMALMTAGLFIWIFVMQRQIRWKTIPLMLGVILAIVANGYLDYWGYGTWTFSAWNYFYANLVQGVASGFGVSPWYYYITKTFAKGIPPLSLFYIISLFYLWVRHPKSLLTWSSFSFCFIHSYLGHKEIRFLFGMFFFIPFCYLIWAPFLTGKIKKFFIALVPVMFVLNTGALFISSIKPAFGPINMYRFLYHESPTVTKIYTLGVFRDQLRFYLKKPIEQVVIKDNVKRDMETLVNERPETVQWYLTDKYQDYLTIKDSKICTIKYASYPTWLLDMSLAKKALKRSKTWSLFRCELLSESGN